MTTLIQPLQQAPQYVSYTSNGSDIFAITTTIPGDNKLVLTHLRQGSPHLGNVTQVELLSHPGTQQPYPYWLLAIRIYGNMIE